jgi:hypothetical protein
LSVAGEGWRYCKFLVLLNLSKACSSKKIEEMKKIIYTTLFVLATSFGFSQNNGQNNETVNHGRVIGSFDLGTQEVTTLIDEETGCVRKSSPHSKGLFNPNEAVEIVLKGNKQMAEIRKPSLSEKVFANKNCNEEQEDCLSDLCVIKNDGNKLIIRYTDGNYKVFFSATLKPNNSIQSNMIIQGGNERNRALPKAFYLDKSNTEQFKLFSHKSVLEEADKLLNQNNLVISDNDEELMEKLILKIKAKEPQLAESDLAKSIFFHVAIIKTVNRAMVSNSNTCDCSPFPLYFINQSPFLCQEDLSYDVNKLLVKLENDSTEISSKYDEETIQKLNTYLRTKSTETDIIPFEELYVELGNGVSSNEFVNVIDDHIETAWCLLGQGSDLGCCGNYSGCCWYWSIHCLAHDLACLNCEPRWFCFDGCVPL